MRSLEELSATPKCATTTEYVEYFVAVPLGKVFPSSGVKFPDIEYARSRCKDEGWIILEPKAFLDEPFTVNTIYVKK